MSIPHVNPGDPLSAKEQNKLIDQLNRSAAPGGTCAMQYGPDGVTGFTPPPPLKVRPFELTSAVTMPDLDGAEASYFNREPTPYASAKILHLHQFDSSDEDADGNPIRSYEVNGSPEVRVYFPLCFKDNNGYAVGHPPLVSGDRCFARWVKGRWEAFAPAHDVWRFTLKTKLVPNKVGGGGTYNPGSTATAYLVDSDLSTGTLSVNTDVEFTVRDQQNRFRGAAYDATYWDYVIGEAKRMPDSDEWEIITMTHKAERIKFKASAAFTTASASVNGTVEDFFNGYNPDPGASGLTIYNWQTSDSTYQYEGDQYDLGWAWYDWTNDKYWINDFECA